MTDSTLASRNAALDLLESVLRKKIPLDDAFDAHEGLDPLEPRDRGFVRLMVATVLRRLGQIDALVSTALTKPDPVRAGVLDILRLGTAQLVFLDTPPHAAVDTSVAAAEQRGLQHYKGLINAVLRRVAREGADQARKQDAGRLNTPDWLWLAWRTAYGTPRTRGIVEANLIEAPLDLTAKGSPGDWAERLEGTVLPTGTIRRASGGQVADLPGYDEGAWWVQDAAAALPAKLFGDIRGKTLYDLCAAPGGKTAQLAAAGAEVTALDRSDRRLRRLSANLERLNLWAETLTTDAATWKPDRPADAVLLDAPCSATGAIRRHPDIPRLKSQEDVTKLAGAQRRLLAHAVDLVKPGGTLVYCTCSLQPEEGEQRIDHLLASGAPVERLPVDPGELGGLSELINERGEVRTLPGQLAELGGIDGFFIARLVRTK
ncbi:RsmB/NOP family class I SAM-dependent RNA methyltransferase [Skermanella pratensis]|uniref:RsmB/NOP family class I SAM-dependent RNA methyltransferase n=1 Tax=Skermanella pratensis TaxID=2233999 RepID=UPI00130138F7|nr:transcription antitermination factor NusB [Skermanella pratensis]